MTRPIALVTNDDGVDSFFFEVLVEALLPDFAVRLAVPAGEQSWIGRAVTRHRALHAEATTRYGAPGWVIDGTPTDCVNLALGRLLEAPPAVVVSGMNIGFNATLPLILGSGTVAGAVEGALWGLPAVAVSQQIPHGHFEAVRKADGRAGPEIEALARRSAAMAAGVVRTVVDAGAAADLTVHNLNFPAHPAEDLRVERTRPALVALGCLFAPRDDGYRFSMPLRRKVLAEHANDDLACLLRGQASHSVIDLSIYGAA